MLCTSVSCEIPAHDLPDSPQSYSWNGSTEEKLCGYDCVDVSLKLSTQHIVRLVSPLREGPGGAVNSVTIPITNALCHHFIHTHIYIYIYIYIYTHSGEKTFDPLLILYVCPLKNKWSVYNFNCWFIWTVRDRITTTTKKSKKKKYRLICILMSEISIWPLCKTWLKGLAHRMRSAAPRRVAPCLSNSNTLFSMCVRTPAAPFGVCPQRIATTV